jgi:nitrate/nitrite transport system ATP-binding protein
MLVPAPKLLLLDGPFGMLDSLTRWELQEVLMEVWQRIQVTAIMITHDVDEAILLSDRVVMMSNGPNAISLCSDSWLNGGRYQNGSG